MAPFSLNFQRLRVHSRDLRYRRDFVRRNTQYFEQTKSNLGDICAVRCSLPNGKPIAVVPVYISVNQNVTDSIDYIRETLLAYTAGGSKLPVKQHHELSLLLGGDFKIDLDIDGLRLVQFFKSSDLNSDFVYEAYNRVEELIALEDVDTCELKEELNVFQWKVDPLENTQSNILDIPPEKDYDAEFGVVEEDLRDKAIQIRTKARRIINGQ
ncbi:uncharacterized protein TNCV_3652431 [Trichonephila clavipes]|nr:uncharacterized protein TNCV_3652431 [Trichonephila clavipes]